MKDRIKTWLGPALVLALFIATIWLLHHELRGYSLHDIVASMKGIPSSRRWAALGLTVLNYAILIGYDWLGVRYVGHRLSFRRIALASFLGFSIGNNFGMLFGGSTVRYRLYSSWGLSALEIVKLLVILEVTFWGGVFALAGGLLTCMPMQLPAWLPIPLVTTRPLGVALAMVAAGYLGICAVRHQPVRVGSWTFSSPRLTFSLLQYGIAALDLMVAAAALYVLLLPVGIGYIHFLVVYLLAIVVALVTQIPGGLGVLELATLVLLNPRQPQAVVAALLTFRVIYYLGPLAVGLITLGANELVMHRMRPKPVPPTPGPLDSVIAPRVLAVMVFQGLRQYKNKFHPIWRPKYLASPGGLALPIILANVVTLISGGVTRLIRK